jgi:hypothetical protein
MHDMICPRRSNTPWRLRTVEGMKRDGMCKWAASLVIELLEKQKTEFEAQEKEELVETLNETIGSLMEINKENL